MIGYFAQNQASLLDENLTVFQTIDDVAIGDIRNKIRDLAGCVHVWWRKFHQESQSTLRRRTNPSGHDKATVGAGESAYSG